MIDSILFFFYHLLWTLVALPLQPFARRPGSTLAERLAFTPPSRTPMSGAIWVHALSVGEVNSAVPLVKALRGRYPRRPIVFTASTRQGVKIARGELDPLVECVLRMPLDCWFVMRRMVRFVDPWRMIVVETDLWPGYLRILRRRGVGTLLVNSRVSPRTLQGYRRFRFLVRRMIFKNIDRCLTQSELDRKRLLAIGVPPEKVSAVGNIKFDREWVVMGPEEKDRLAGSLGFRAGQEIWVAGSTHRGEEGIVLNVFLRLRPAFPDLRLVIAPRRIEESGEVLRSALNKGFKAVLRTSAAGGGDFDVLVLDTLGELGKVYGLGRIAFVGGSLFPEEGGHNLLEPASLGVPVLFGPYMHSFVSMSQLLLEAEGGRGVENEEGMFRVMTELLSDRGKAEAMGRNARAFAERNRGALERVLEHISL